MTIFEFFSSPRWLQRLASSLARKKGVGVPADALRLNGRYITLTGA